MVKDSRLAHITQFDRLVIVSEKQVHALNVTVDDSSRMQMEQSHTDLPCIAPEVLFR